MSDFPSAPMNVQDLLALADKLEARVDARHMVSIDGRLVYEILDAARALRASALPPSGVDRREEVKASILFELDDRGLLKGVDNDLFEEIAEALVSKSMPLPSYSRGGDDHA